MTTIRAKDSGPLMSIITAALPGWKKSTLKQYLRFKGISVNGQTIQRHNHPIEAGDEIILELGPKPQAIVILPHDIHIIFEDEALIVVDKPCGVLSVPSPPHHAPVALTELNRYLSARSGPATHAQRVHRLDKPVSGVLLFAKSTEVRGQLIEEWKNFEKTYLALVEGTLSTRAGTLTNRLVEDPDMRMRVDENAPQAKLAITRYRLLASHHGHSLVQCWIDTGIKNQIRVQLAALGHPILGDKKYGARADPLNRLALHAWRLRLKHPLLGTDVTIESPYPRSFGRLFPEPRL